MDVKKFLHDTCAKKAEQVSPIRVYKHPFRLKREQLAKWMGEWGFKKGAEIGVRAGKFSEVLCQSMPGLELICVDPWSVGDYRSNMIGQEKQEAYYQECVERLKPYPGVNIIRRTSLDAVVGVADESLDFVYIDGCHEFDDIMLDVILWSRKVRTDGIVAGHDYYRFKKAGVVHAIDLYTYMHKIDEWFITDEKEPTWFWAKRKPW